MAQGPESSDDVHWCHHPLKRRPAAGACVLLLALSCSWLAVRYVDSPLLSLPIVALFLHSLQAFFLPASYRVDREGVTIATPFGSKLHDWSRFGGYQVGPRAVRLTRLARPSALDRWQGLVLHLDDEVRPRVLACLRKRFGA